MIPVLKANIPYEMPPSWALWQRKLIEALDGSVYPFLQKYTHEDGTLIWKERWDPDRDGVDDIYESFYNWPLLYLLGGGDHLLTLGLKEWEALTRQLTAMGPVYKEYERGYDHFHQSEGYLFFYFLCLADPTNPRLIEQARRFAGFYLNEDPEAPNYDAERKLIRAPHNGSGGPRWGFQDGPDPVYSWNTVMRHYGLPYADVPGIRHYDDLKDPELARRMGAVMQERMGRGDVATNLMATSLIANAYLMTGESKYRDWVLEYMDAWIERADRNGGLLPDNIGLSGAIGEYIQGKWYGGLYGWTWPHGFYNIVMAAIVAATNAYLVSRQPAYLELPRAQMDRILSLGVIRRVDDLGEYGISYQDEMEPYLPLEREELFVVPYRYGDGGWFEYQSMHLMFPVALWNLSMHAGDWERIERLRQGLPYDGRRVASFRDKHDAGHELPWLRFLAGDNPDYPEAILRESYGQLVRRLEMIRQDASDLTRANEHHWQQRNPVLTEALIQLTLGAPQVIYNGGLLACRLRYFDPQRRRPGLPSDVAALVEKLEADRTVVRLVNLSPFEARRLLIQAGGFGEHQFVNARYDIRSSEYPGNPSIFPPKLTTETHSERLDGKLLEVHIEPGCEIGLDLEMRCYTNQPAYTSPWI